MPGKKYKTTLTANKDKKRNSIPFEEFLFSVMTSVTKWIYASNKIKEQIRKKEVIASALLMGA